MTESPVGVHLRPMHDPATSLLGLFGDLARRSVTGRLDVVGGLTKRSIYFEDGLIVQASSQVESETLGRILVERGDIDEAQLGEALRTARNELRQLGDVLVEMKATSAARIFDALQQQVRRRIFNCLRLEAPLTGLHPGVPRPAGTIAVPLHVPDLILEAAETVLGPDRLRAALPGLEDAHVRLVGGRADDLELGLSEAERRWVSVLEGEGAPFSALVEAGYDRDGAVALVFTLHVLGLVALSGGATLGAGLAPAEGDDVHPTTRHALARRRALRRRLMATLRGQVASQEDVSTPEATTEVGPGGDLDVDIEETPDAETVIAARLSADAKAPHLLLGVPEDASPEDARAAAEVLKRRLSLDAPPAAWSPEAREAAEDLAAKIDEAAQQLGRQARAEPAAEGSTEPEASASRAGATTASGLMEEGLALTEATRARVLGRPDEAEALLRDALERFPDSASLALMLGMLLYEEGEPDAARLLEAEAWLDRSAALDPAAPTAWLHLGRLHRRRGRLATARVVLEAALQRDPRGSAAAELADLPAEPPPVASPPRRSDG